MNKNTLWIYSIEILFSLFLIFILVSFNSCSDDDGFGPYYEGTYIDRIILGSELDSVNIIIEQLGINSKIKDNIPCLITNDPSLDDSIRLTLLVYFGSYTQKPIVIKEIREEEDSIFIWYSTKGRNFKTLLGSNNILEAKTSPKIDYVSISTVVIDKSSNKFVKFFSRRL